MARRFIGPARSVPFVAAVVLIIYGVLVLPKNETASHYHMKAKLLVLLALFLARRPGRPWLARFAWARRIKTTEHMAVAIWVMMGAIMSVMGGVGAFGFHLWRHANTPLEPHQELTDEDLERYD